MIHHDPELTVLDLLSQNKKQMSTKDFTLASNFSKVLYRTCMQLQIGLHLTRDSFSQLCTDERIRNDNFFNRHTNKSYILDYFAN